MNWLRDGDRLVNLDRVDKICFIDDIDDIFEKHTIRFFTDDHIFDVDFDDMHERNMYFLELQHRLCP
jgi:hypothetical protein